MNTKSTFLGFFFAFFVLSQTANAQIDTVPPEIHIWGDTACIQPNSVWVEQISVSDNQTDSANIVLTKTWGSKGPVNTGVIGNYSITYEATDTNGNKSTKVVTYKIQDCIPPVINLNTDDTVCHPFRTAYNSIQPTVTDNYYPSGQVSLVRKSTNVNPNVRGTYTELYEAVDGAGNTTIKTRVVIVGDCNTSGLNSRFIEAAYFYPNPASDLLHLYLPALYKEGGSLQLISVDGRVIENFSLTPEMNTIQVSNLTAGIYMLQITLSDGVYLYTLYISH